MNPRDVKLNDLPELPFAKILSYLSLEDRIRSRAVSRGLRKKIDSFKVRSLFCSDRAIGFILEKSVWMNDGFTRNFIRSPRIESLQLFLQTFSPSILSHLRRLCLHEFVLEETNEFSTLARTLKTFYQLEELSLFRFEVKNPSSEIDLELNLPALKRIYLNAVYAINRLTLDTPMLQKVKLVGCLRSFKLDFVHLESVEWLITEEMQQIEVKTLTNLKYLYTKLSKIDSTFLLPLKQLEEVHLNIYRHVKKLFEQKRRYGRVDLKIYLNGLHLNGPEDPEIDSVVYNEPLCCLTENPTRVANEIHFHDSLKYSEIESTSMDLAINIVNRFNGSSAIDVYEPIQDIERFLNFLKGLTKISCLLFVGDQPQALFDRLPDYCAVQWLIVKCALSDLRFLSSLKSLVYLELLNPIDIESVEPVLEDLPYLLQFDFKYRNKKIMVLVEHRKRFTVTLPCGLRSTVNDSNSAIQYIIEKTRDG